MYVSYKNYAKYYDIPYSKQNKCTCMLCKKERSVEDVVVTTRAGQIYCHQCLDSLVPGSYAELLAEKLENALIGLEFFYDKDVECIDGLYLPIFFIDDERSASITCHNNGIDLVCRYGLKKNLTVKEVIKYLLMERC